MTRQAERVKQVSPQAVVRERNDEPFSDEGGDRFMFWATLITGIIFVAILYFAFGIGQ